MKRTCHAELRHLKNNLTKKPKLNGNNNQRAIKCIVPYTDMASSNPNGRDKKIN